MANEYNPNAALYMSALKKLAERADARLDALEGAGAQANVLEDVKVNGVALTIADKIVDILIATGATNGTLSVAGIDVAVKGLAALAYKAEVGYDDLAAALKTVIDNKAAASDVSTLIGSDTGKSVRSIANEELAAQLIPEGAKESLDTLQEIAAWIQAHPDDVTAINAAIAKLEGIVAGIGGKDDTYKTVAAYVEGAITAALSGIAAGATKTEASNQNGYIKINGTETKVYEHPATTAAAAAFVKVGKDAAGHVVVGDPIAKSDITALGIPAQDTTYEPATQAAAGLMSGDDKTKLDGIVFATDAEVNAMLDEVFGTVSNG